MASNYYQKQKKSSEKKNVKDIKIFLKKRNRKNEKMPEIDIKIFLKKKKKKASVSS